MRSVPLQNSLPVQKQSCQPKQSLPWQANGCPCIQWQGHSKCRVKWKQLNPKGFPSLPLSCAFSHCSSAEEQQLILCQTVRRDVHQVQRQPKEQKLPWASPTQAPRQPLMRSWLWMWEGEHPQLLLLMPFAKQSSATNHTVLRVPTVRRCPHNRARQVSISDSTVFFSQASDKPG